MLDSVLVSVQALIEKGTVWGVKRGVFVLLTYIELALDRTMVQSSNLVFLMWGHKMSVVMHLCVLSICL